MTPEEAVIDSMYAAYFAGDVDGAIAHCAPGAMFHCVTPAPIHGDLSMRDYFTTFLPNAIEEMADYNILSVEREVLDELVVSRLRSTHGSGLMVFRVVDSKVSDLWVINTNGRETTGYF